MKRMIAVIVIILLAAVGTGVWWFTRPPAAASEVITLFGSGTVEADETVAITAELGGRILELKVDQGDDVKAGQVLVELDQADLLALKTQLGAGLTTARADLELVGAPAQAEEVAAAQAQLSQAEVARDGARLTWERAKDLANDPHALEAKINQAQAGVNEAESELEMAQVNLKRMEIQAEAASRNQVNHDALVQSEAAQYQLQAARVGVELAEVALAGAKRQVEHLIQLRSLPLPLIAQANAAEAVYRQAEAAVQASQANLNAAKADATPEDVALAEAQVREGEAALAAVEVQLAKQSLTAPRDGLISEKLVDPGELAAPGAVLLELKDIDSVELTVYIPQDQVGQVKIGQKALVSVDAYEDQQFEGRVSYIAHEAEFTPRNVQTKEERVKLVFPVKIKLDNPDHRLKPGMPADAEILLTSEAGIAEAPSAPILAEPTVARAAVPTLAPVEATSTVAPASTVAPIPTATEAPAPVQAEVVSWGLNVRSGPGVRYPVIASLVKGDIVPVIEVDPDSGWLHVLLPGGEQSGWVSGKPAYVSIINPRRQ
jgi:multidrug resistance efflux pump